MLRYVDMHNAFEADLTAYPPERVDDLLNGACPQDCVVLVDAEMEVVGFAKKDKAPALIELLNWACEHYPFRVEDNDEKNP